MIQKQEIISFYDGIKSQEKKGLKSPKERSSIEIAIKLAYGDAKRTMTGIGKFDKEKDIAFKNLEEKFFVYFNNKAPADKDTFDTIHNKLCAVWCDAFSKASPTHIGRYGKAQKIVNMAFKYLYCCEDISECESYFVFCHMPLDRFTLEWYKRVTSHDDKTDKVKLPYDMTWSKLGESLYLDITNKIQDKLKQDLYLTDVTGNKIPLPKEPLMAEFIIWPNIQLQMATEEFYFAYKDITDTKEKENFKKESLEEKIKQIKNVLL